MKQLLITIAAVVLVGCGESQQSTTAPEVKPVEPVDEAAHPEPSTAKVPDIPIIYAARDGNIEAVKQHLAAGTDVNAKDEYSGYTSLHHAANHGLNEIAKLLIKKGANVNLKADFGYTPLMLATNTVIAELLIKNGANVNATHQHGTGLHIAAGVGNRSVAEWFIANGADVNAKSDFGTPLDFAIVRDHTEITALFFRPFLIQLRTIVKERAVSASFGVHQQVRPQNEGELRPYPQFDSQITSAAADAGSVESLRPDPCLMRVTRRTASLTKYKTCPKLGVCALLYYAAMYTEF